MPRALVAADSQQRRRAPFWRGAAGALALAFWSVTGVLGAALALIPVMLERGPRGSAGRALAERSRVRLVAPLPPEPAAGEASPGPVRAVRAASDAFPG